MNLRVEQVITESQFESLHEEWNLLLTQSANNDITLTWEWLYTWWHVFKDDTRRLMILTVRDLEGRLVGIAPLQWITVRPYFFLPTVRQITFLAFGEAEEDEICTDYLNFIIHKGDEAEVIAKIWAYLMGDLVPAWDQIVLDRVCSDSANFLQLRAVTAGLQHQCSYQEVPKGRCYFIPLPGTWDVFMADLDNGLRSKYRRDVKRSSAKGTVVYTLAQTPSELKQGFALLKRLHQMRWAEKGSAGVFSSEKFVMFHEQFSEMAFKNGTLQLRWLQLDGMPLAVIYNFLYNHKIYFYQSGIDTQHKDIAPGMLMHGYCIQEAISQNIREYDFLDGEAAYKARWTKHFRDLTTVRIEFNTLKMRIIRWIKAVYK